MEIPRQTNLVEDKDGVEKKQEEEKKEGSALPSMARAHTQELTRQTR